MTSPSTVATRHTDTVVVSTGHRIAAVVLMVTALGLVIGSFVAISAILTYQLVLNIVLAAALVYAALLVLRGHPRARTLAIVATWLTAIAVTVEAGGHQDRMNDTGQLGASNTEYFLPGLIWIAIGLLFVIAIAVITLTKRVRGS